jgi:hypothetical protein
MTEKEILLIADGVIPPGWLDERARYIVHFAQLIAAAEREACAKVCDAVAELPNDLMSDAPHIAAAIRARGQA